MRKWHLVCDLAHPHLHAGARRAPLECREQNTFFPASVVRAPRQHVGWPYGGERCPSAASVVSLTVPFALGPDSGNLTLSQEPACGGHTHTDNSTTKLLLQVAPLFFLSPYFSLPPAALHLWPLIGTTTTNTPPSFVFCLLHVFNLTYEDRVTPVH